MGTTVGLAIGLVLAGLPTRVNAYRITGKLVTNEWGLRGLIRRTSALLRTGGVPVPPEAEVRRRIELHHEQLGEGYGRPTAACEQAAERFAQAGLKLDPTYTAKAAAGLLAAVEAEPQRTHLFWQTLSGSEPPCTPAKIADLPEPFRRYLDGR
jgi:1-aminocyclopropane-1-carboxylate deaminase/D-cysteine desulfhydrase-like pyridoxal-dependent ACC family enzyme